MPSGASPAIGRPSNSIVPSVAGVQARDQLEQRRLAATRRADDGEELAAPELEVERAERVQRRRRLARHEHLADVGSLTGSSATASPYTTA